MIVTLPFSAKAPPRKNDSSSVIPDPLSIPPPLPPPVPPEGMAPSVKLPVAMAAALMLPVGALPPLITSVEFPLMPPEVPPPLVLDAAANPEYVLHAEETSVSCRRPLDRASAHPVALADHNSTKAF